MCVCVSCVCVCVCACAVGTRYVCAVRCVCVCQRRVCVRVPCACVRACVVGHVCERERERGGGGAKNCQRLTEIANPVSSGSFAR